MSNETSIRRLARRHGYVLRKSRRDISPDNHGEFMLVEARQNIVALGPHFDASLEDVAEWFSESE